MQRLDFRVFPEAQIAAVYVLYALFGTQPSKPVSQIYVNPTHRAGLCKALQVFLMLTAHINAMSCMSTLVFLPCTTQNESLAMFDGRQHTRRRRCAEDACS